MWEYWFTQPGNYSLGSPSVRGKPVLSVQVALVDSVAEGPVRSYPPWQQRRKTRSAANAVLGNGGVRLVRKGIRDDAERTFARWRKRSSHILGVHLRGTDKVVRQKVPSGGRLHPYRAVTSTLLTPS